MFQISKKTIISGAIGTALEMYDYIIWGLFSVYLAKEFLPGHAQLTDIFSIFLISYFFRPLGSFVGGIIADRYGRKTVLTFSILMMGIGTFAVGILPGYSQIGYWSVFFLLVIRLLQALAVGGEYISSISLLIESCRENEKGYYGSWAAFGVNLGMLIASLVGAYISYLIEYKITPEWSWRFAFLISWVTVLFGFWIRRSIPESFGYIMENALEERRSTIVVLKEVLVSIKERCFESFLVFVLVLLGVSTTTLVFIYGPIHMARYNFVSHAQALAINSLNSLIVILLIPFFGAKSDKFGRIKLISWGIILLDLLVLPYFYIISAGNFLQIILFQILIAIPCAIIFAVIPILITEIFPLSIRCSMTGILYSCAACLGGGLTPLISLKLISLTNLNFAPSFLPLGLGLLNLIILAVYIKKKGRAYGRLTLVSTPKTLQRETSTY